MPSARVSSSTAAEGARDWEKLGHDVIATDQFSNTLDPKWCSRRRIRMIAEDLHLCTRRNGDPFAWQALRSGHTHSGFDTFLGPRGEDTERTALSLYSYPYPPVSVFSACFIPTLSLDQYILLCSSTRSLASNTFSPPTSFCHCPTVSQQESNTFRPPSRSLQRRKLQQSRVRDSIAPELSTSLIEKQSIPAFKRPERDRKVQDDGTRNSSCHRRVSCHGQGF